MNALFTTLVLILSTSVSAQLTVDKLDQEIKKSIKGKVTHYKKGDKCSALSVYAYKSDNRIFSVMKQNKFVSGKKTDSLIMYQFAFINDTLLRVWHTRSDLINKTTGMIIVYINQDKILVIKNSGVITMPNIQDLIVKSNELKVLAKELVNSKLKVSTN